MLKSLLLVLLLAVTVTAGTSWELDGTDCDTMPMSSYFTADTALHFVWFDDGGVGVRSLQQEKYDSTTHYIAGLDTVLVDREIECDTVWQKYQTDSLSGYIVKAIVCDTTLRFKTQPIWKPLVTVMLRPDQVVRLMSILEREE